ncbi:hypothetical protein B296_00049208 [Ensete ventricosum]|uniref:Uncharacterized protein n=1 Tax=Ensete ventricosum TaxID=4639 RepID=A0A426YRM1_ENSVE|nr:hypothetical protein B296_00049208 [Ensete ventricosum]
MVGREKRPLRHREADGRDCPNVVIDGPHRSTDGAHGATEMVGSSRGETCGCPPTSSSSSTETSEADLLHHRRVCRTQRDRIDERSHLCQQTMNRMLSCLETFRTSSMLLDQIEPQHQPALLWNKAVVGMRKQHQQFSIIRCTVVFVHNPFSGFSTLPYTRHVRAKVETPAAITALRSWIT